MPFHKSPQTSIVDVRPMGEPPPGREVKGLLPPRASRHLDTESEMTPALVLFHCVDEALGKCGTETKDSRGLSNNFEVQGDTFLPFRVVPGVVQNIGQGTYKNCCDLERGERCTQALVRAIRRLRQVVTTCDCPKAKFIVFYFLDFIQPESARSGRCHL